MVATALACSTTEDEASPPPAAGESRPDASPDASGPTPDAAAPDAKAPTDTADAGEAGIQCNTLQNVASDVEILAVPQAAPDFEGGAITPGTYAVTAATRYTGSGGMAAPTGQTVRMTFRFILPEVESVIEEATRSATVVVDGTNLVTTTTCPENSTVETSYTATESTLRVLVGKQPYVLVYELTRLGQ